MEFMSDYISENSYWTILLIIHGLLAVALLGGAHASNNVCDCAGAEAGGSRGFCDALPRGSGRGLCVRGLRAMAADFPYRSMDLH